MRTVVRQLERVRTAGRWMLIAQRLSQWITAVIAALLGLGLIDFALRLPGLVRLVIGIGLAGAAAAWLVGRIVRAMVFRPGLADLALRAESIYPQLAESLATAVEFTTCAEQYHEPPRTRQLARTSIDRVRVQLGQVRLRRLLDPYWTSRMLALLFVAAVALASVVFALPDASRIVAARWFAPLGGAQWPKRTDVINLTTERVWPVDTPLRLSAGIRRGYRPGMRVWVRYRLMDSSGRPGDWRSLLLSEQATASMPGTFERLIDLAETLDRVERSEGTAMGRSGGGEGQEPAVEFYFEAGDDRTEPARLALVVRPEVTSVMARISPPTYAAGLVSDTPRGGIAMHEQSGQLVTAAVLVGSDVRLDIAFNKALPVVNGTITPGLQTLAGLTDEGPTATADSPGVQTSVSLRLRMQQSMESRIHLVDRFGLTNLSQRRYRLEAIEDKAPTVSLVRPAANESVLATAVVSVEALARDDVGLEELAMEYQVQRRAKGQPIGGTLVQWAGRQADATVSGELDLSRVDAVPLKPGDAVVLTATAADVFDLDGQRHSPVRSAPRRLHIIDAATLVSQLRNELAGVRQQAVRLQRTQRGLSDLPEGHPASAIAPVQAQITRRLGAQGQLVDRLVERAQRNRLDDARLSELMERGAELIRSGRSASEHADQHLQGATDQPQLAGTLRQEAQLEQLKVVDVLAELVAALDQGRDAMTLQLQLRQLRTRQENAAADARRLLPQTVALRVEELTCELREALQALAGHQSALGLQAEALVRQMQTTAEALAVQGAAGSDEERAAAEALADAAAIARRQGLSQSMKQSAESIGANRLAQAGHRQSDSLDTMQRMLSQLASTDQRRQQLLLRRLLQLERAIERLIERQHHQVAALIGAKRDGDLPALQFPQTQVRRHTIAVEEQARPAPSTQPVAEALGQAVQDQAKAILALRQGQRHPARTAEDRALADLEEALRSARMLRAEAATEQVRRDRQQLKQEYEKLAGWQEQLRGKAGAVATVAPMSRQQRAMLIGLGNEESDLRLAAEYLGEKVDQTLVFRYLHGRVDEAAGRAERKLRQALADEGLLRDQNQVAIMLRIMAQALDPGVQAEPFAGGQPEPGGGAGGGEPPLVPPVAELKLLRGMQQAVYDQTRRLGEPDVSVAGPRWSARGWLLELATQQRELSALGERLIERMRRSMGRTPGRHRGRPQADPLEAR